MDYVDIYLLDLHPKICSVADGFQSDDIWRKNITIDVRAVHSRKTACKVR